VLRKNYEEAVKNARNAKLNAKAAAEKANAIMQVKAEAAAEAKRIEKAKADAEEAVEIKKIIAEFHEIEKNPTVMNMSKKISASPTLRENYNRMRDLISDFLKEYKYGLYNLVACSYGLNGCEISDTDVVLSDKYLRMLVPPEFEGFYSPYEMGDPYPYKNITYDARSTLAKRLSKLVDEGKTEELKQLIKSSITNQSRYGIHEWTDAVFDYYKDILENAMKCSDNNRCKIRNDVEVNNPAGFIKAITDSLYSLEGNLGQEIYSKLMLILEAYRKQKIEQQERAEREKIKKIEEEKKAKEYEEQFYKDVFEELKKYIDIEGNREKLISMSPKEREQFINGKATNLITLNVEPNYFYHVRDMFGRVDSYPKSNFYPGGTVTSGAIKKALNELLPLP